MTDGAENIGAEARGRDWDSVHARLLEAALQARDAGRKCTEALEEIRGAERRHAVRLAVGFVLLVVLTAVATFAMWNMRASVRHGELKHRHETYENALNSKRMLEAELEKERQGASAAYEVFRLMELGQLEESLAKFAEIGDKITHPAEAALLSQRMDGIRTVLAENAYHAGVSSFAVADYERARDEFEKSLSLRANAPYTPRLDYHMAMSLYQLGDYDGAATHFDRASTAELGPDMDAGAMFYRAATAEKLGDETGAREMYERFLRKYRFHKFADEAVRRKARLDRNRTDK